MLPFEKDDKRRYTCFICGLQFKYQELEDYKCHIINSHEEGREYIVCPLERCKFPVRDMRSHFRVFHPHDIIPKNMQMKVMVWKDQGTNKRKKLKFEEGFFISLKNNGKAMHYRSSYEKKIYECLEKINTVTSYSVEPFFIKYFWSNKLRKYYPDLLIEYTDGSKKLVEIKPSAQTASDQNRAKWNAAADYCLTCGMTFEVFTETAIGKLMIEAEQST